MSEERHLKPSKTKLVGFFKQRSDGGCKLRTDLSIDTLRMISPSAQPPDGGYLIGGREQFRQDLDTMLRNNSMGDELSLRSDNAQPPDGEEGVVKDQKRFP